jgi:putative SOS response-associated peptidase YedK
MFPESNLFNPDEDFNAFAHPKLPVITGENPEQIALFHWGMVPAWVKDEALAQKLKKSTLNARIETAFEKPSFREAMRYQRCLIPADAFYEWQHVQTKDKAKAEKIKYKISTDQEIFCFAGIWDTWKEQPKGDIWTGFSILTMPANPLMKKIHNTAHRMPFILRPENEMKWLDPERRSLDDLEELIVPYSEELMKAEPVISEQ